MSTAYATPTAFTRAHGRATTRSRARGNRDRSGLGLIELLISLAITSALLTAVAVATAVSAKVVTDNDEFTRAAQAARVALNLMLSDCRRGAPDANEITNTTLGVVTAENAIRTYRYDEVAQQILLSDLDALDQPGLEHVVVRNVSAARFDVTSSGTPLAVRRVTVNLTVSIGGNAVHLSGSAAPRQNATY
ncbi:MAG TPA: prepilin-type N-terminal cleavage/methylation domain-containing protein [Tepidisphaeraceae bacterium]|jgi:type II secretory pathway pseudopilin PulG|nr:prepilin-type N-terminal cleavage/methylation domain-containing protein [Tepidisphaeraceae bacterium]